MKDKIREEFEAWVIRLWPAQSLAKFNGGEYQGFTVQHCWEAWQGSRSSVVIELPEHHEYDSPGEVIPVIKDCRKAIEAAGLRVKP